MKDYKIISYDLKEHWKQIEKYMFENIEDIETTAITWFIDKKDANYYNPRFVAIHEEQVVWFIYWSFSCSSSNIWNLCVFKKHRKKWIWKMLLNEFEKYIKINNQTLLTLVCFEKNKKAIDFYKKQGFVKSWYNDYSSMISWKWNKWILLAKQL